MNNLLEMLNASPVNFLVVNYLEEKLKANGFEKLDPTKSSPILMPEGCYYMVKNDSALFAFRVGNGTPSKGFKLICAHSDSPCFRIKPHPEMYSEGGIVRLNTEVYGGPILYTWFDRPLSLAGRVVLRGKSPLYPEKRLLHIKRPLLVIPHLAIHFNRQVNEGNPLSKQRDMMPVLGIITNELERENLLVNTIAEELKVDVKDILDFELSLYDATPACLCGLHNEFVSSGRQDDLVMVHAGLEALLQSKPGEMSQVLAVFDNEETGNVTKQGSASPVLRNLLSRIISNRGGANTDLYRSIFTSFLISADMAHALHPNYPEKYDPTNHPVMGGGPVIKVNANQKYVTDSESSAIFAEICRNAGVPFQYFVNNSDFAGGSTLGNSLSTQLPIRGVDMGNPLWAMHSIRETTAAIDCEYTIKAFSSFYNL